LFNIFIKDIFLFYLIAMKLFNIFLILLICLISALSKNIFLGEGDKDEPFTGIIDEGEVEKWIKEQEEKNK